MRTRQSYGPFRSAPAQNACPSPVIIPTRNVGSASYHSHNACNSWCPAVLIQFSDAGRESVTSSIYVAGKEILENDVDGGGMRNFAGFENAMIYYGDDRTVNIVVGCEGIQHKMPTPARYSAVQSS